MDNPTEPTVAPPAKPHYNPVVRAVVDYAGLIAFVAGFFLFHRDLVKATWCLVAVSGAALALALVVERRIAPLPLLTGLAALTAGLLTLIFKDPVFVKMKATVINLILGSGLLIGLALGKNPLKLLLGDALKLSEGAWRKLTVRYGIFFLLLAGLNEVVWRTQKPEIWILFRMPGMPLLAVLFSFTQVPLMMKEAQAMEAAADIAETQGD